MKLEFSKEQLDILTEINAPYDPYKNYTDDYFNCADFEDSAIDKLLVYVRDKEIMYAQASSHEREKASAVAVIADILAQYAELIDITKESHNAPAQATPRLAVGE